MTAKKAKKEPNFIKVVITRPCTGTTLTRYHLTTAVVKNDMLAAMEYAVQIYQAEYPTWAVIATTCPAKEAEQERHSFAEFFKMMGVSVQ